MLLIFANYFLTSARKQSARAFRSRGEKKKRSVSLTKEKPVVQPKAVQVKNTPSLREETREQVAFLSFRSGRAHTSEKIIIVKLIGFP